jgi:NAD(P)-dependent dehydrogenase (short-subunit alcohol dehydrogenase family)
MYYVGVLSSTAGTRDGMAQARPAPEQARVDMTEQHSAPVTVVTGGSRGIGAATCLQLAAAEQARELGRQAVAHRLDTTDSGQVSALFDAAEQLGPLTGLVNNAGVGSRIGPFVELTEADLRHVMDVNVIGYFLCAQQAARRLTAGGAIVNVSSAAATTGSPREYVHYAASKGAVDTMTLGLARELGPRGIRVNAVSPAIIRTDFHAGAGQPDRPDRLGPNAPLGRAGEVDEVASAIVWLLGTGASYTSGAILRVAGGL